MAEGIATRSSRGHRTICVPIEEEDYLRIIHDPKAFRRTLDDCFRQTPELFPVNFALGYELKDDRMSAKQQIPIRRILLKDDSAYSIRPSFLMPYMTVRTADVEGPLFLRKFGVPFWALARVFGGDPMSWYRMECGLGRFSVVGTTVRTATLPEHLESVPKALCCGPSPWSLVPKPIPVLRPGQPTEHQLNHADPDLRLAGISQVFIILAVNPAPTQPAEGSLHHPPPRQQLKPSVPGKPADDLNHIPPVLRDPSVQGVIVVLGVRPQLPQARERFSRQLAEDLRCRRRIIHGRTGHGHG